MNFRDQLHPQWRAALLSQLDFLDSIEEQVRGGGFLPQNEVVMRAFAAPLDGIKVLILGQDPYPTHGHANGLAFSVQDDVTPLPKSLQNIFKEYESDLGKAAPLTGDLSIWAEQGVALINRILTVAPGRSNSHQSFGWRDFSESVAQVLGQRDVVAILWGNNAQELSPYFRNEWSITSPHPSPLSAYRGFFGSRPFTRANQILKENGAKPILW